MKYFKPFFLCVTLAALTFGCASSSLGSMRPSAWPPQVSKAYPDLELINQDGNPTRLSAFKGSVIIVEPVGMNCAGCLAFSGAHQKGRFKGYAPQEGLDSFEHYLRDIAPQVSMQRDGIVFVQLLLYSPSMTAPTLSEVKDWAKHFDFKTSNGQYVLQGTPEMINDASYNMIPGFQLIDRRFILRSDSTGHAPKHSLYNHLIPMIPKLLKEAA